MAQESSLRERSCQQYANAALAWRSWHVDQFRVRRRENSRAGLFGNSYVLIADGIESALDIAGSSSFGAASNLPRVRPTKRIPTATAKRSQSRRVIVAMGVIRCRDGLGDPKRARNFHAAPRPGAVHARRADRRNCRKGDFSFAW